LLDGGSVHCWGSSFLGALGYGTDEGQEDHSELAGVDVGGPVKHITSGLEHTCALLVDGRVRCWGNGANGRLGYGNVENIGDDETPASAGDVVVGGEVLELQAGHEHTCALLAGDAVRCWGRNDLGQLGYGHTEDVGDNETPADAGDVPYR
jgi:alpha-tubulin suppressor-like RCC1 family protein